MFSYFQKNVINRVRKELSSNVSSQIGLKKLKCPQLNGVSLHFLNAKTKQLVCNAISLCIDSIFAQLSEDLIKGRENDFFC